MFIDDCIFALSTGIERLVQTSHFRAPSEEKRDSHDKKHGKTP